MKYIVTKRGSRFPLFKILEGTKTDSGLELPSGVPVGAQTFAAVKPTIVPYEYLTELNEFITIIAAITGGLAIIAANWKKITK